VFFVEDSTIGAERYAPPRDGNIPIIKGMDIIEIFLFVKMTCESSVILLIRPVCFKAYSKDLIRVRDKKRFRDTLDVNPLKITDGNL
jgi:hypothetical protein